MTRSLKKENVYEFKLAPLPSLQLIINIIILILSVAP